MALLVAQSMGATAPQARLIPANIVRNMDPWYQTFGVQPGRKLYLAPVDRVRIW
jgi:predicted metalloendopeptidase